MDDIKVYRVINVRKEDCGFVLEIDLKGIDDPKMKDELLLIESRRHQNRIGFFRNREWLVQGRLASGRVLLYED